MEFSISIIANQEYYNELYSELIKTLKFKKYERVIGILLILFGIYLFIKDKTNVLNIFPLFFILAGIYELFKFYYDKKKWMNERINSKIFNQTLNLTFNEIHIQSNGPFTNATLNWNGLQNIVQTEKGIFLKPENGISIYLPNYAFENKEQMDFILKRK